MLVYQRVCFSYGFSIQVDLHDPLGILLPLSRGASRWAMPRSPPSPALPWLPPAPASAASPATWRGDSRGMLHWGYCSSFFNVFLDTHWILIGTHVFQPCWISGGYPCLMNWIVDQQSWLVGGLEDDFYDFPYIGNVILPNWRTHIFQRGWLKPPTRYSFWM